MEATSNSDELRRCSVFYGSAFPSAKKVELLDPNHFLNKRNLLYEDSTDRFFEVRCFERDGIFFFGQNVINSTLRSTQRATSTASPRSTPSSCSCRTCGATSAR